MVDASQAKGRVVEADALYSNERGFGLAVFGGDCPGLAICDGKGGFGLAHCGWRGTAKGIVEALLSKMLAKQGDLGFYQAFVGPGISGDRYEVDELVLDAHSWPEQSLTHQQQGRAHLDLKEAIYCQLLNLGLLSEQISISSICTFKDPNLHSFRHSGKGVNQLLTLAF